jgi:hypothetical protein
MGARPSEVAPERGGRGSVVLDIGEDTGAAVVTGADCLNGHEIEIRAEAASWDGCHVAFRQWDVSTGNMVAAVFPQLTAGRWAARMRGVGGPVIHIDVRGGGVTTVAYPG